MNILIIDNFPIFRKGIMSILEDNFTNSKVYEASNVAEALICIRKYSPKIVFIDVSISDQGKYKFIEKIKKENESIKIAVMGSCIKKEEFARYSALGINGFILRNALIEDFVYATKVINREKTYLDPELMIKMNLTSSNIEALTRREQDVLLEISKGKTNSEIAKNLFISEHTVKKHIGSIFSKLHLSNRTEAALYAEGISV